MAVVPPQRDQSHCVKASLHCYTHIRARNREREKERGESVIVSSGENHRILQCIGGLRRYSVENRRDPGLAG